VGTWDWILKDVKGAPLRALADQAAKRADQERIFCVVEACAAIQKAVVEHGETVGSIVKAYHHLKKHLEISESKTCNEDEEVT